MVRLLVACRVLAAPGAAATDRTEERAYVGGADVGGCVLGAPVSSACFLLGGAERSVAIDVVDDAG